jgi:hypothetical protein
VSVPEKKIHLKFDRLSKRQILLIAGETLGQPLDENALAQAETLEKKTRERDSMRRAHADEMQKANAERKRIEEELARLSNRGAGVLGFLDRSRIERERNLQDALKKLDKDLRDSQKRMNILEKQWAGQKSVPEDQWAKEEATLQAESRRREAGRRSALENLDRLDRRAMPAAGPNPLTGRRLFYLP